jgi:lipoprotein-anchoring transpeptidase ErfK/SrfK
MSYFGNWYMPNYLPIGYINGQYRFGFHSIPYHMDGAGNIYSRDSNTMGSPATGGCIQLSSEDSLELFNWAWVGMPVYVYE